MRWTVWLGLVLGASACSSGIFPPIEHVALPPRFADDPSGAVVVLRDTQMRFRAPGEDGGPQTPSLVITTVERISVTNDKLDPSLYRRTLPQSDLRRVRLARARLAPALGAVVEVDALAQGPRPGETLVLELPRPTAGDLIDVRIEEELLRPDLLTPHVFAAAAPMLEGRLRVIAPTSMDVRIVSGRGTNVAPPLGGEPGSEGEPLRAWSIVEQDIQAAPLEPWAPHPQRVSAWAVVSLVSVTHNGNVERYADTWATVGARAKAELAPATQLPDDLRQELARGALQPRVRALRERLRPIADHAPFGPVRATSPLPERPTQLEAAAMAAALTADTPNPASVALVVPSDGPILIDDAPGLYAFRGALVAIPERGGWRFADPACLNCGFSRVPADLAGGRALVLSDAPELVDVPLGMVESTRSRFQFAWEVDGQGLTGSLLADLDGELARDVAARMNEPVLSGEAAGALRAPLFGPAATFELRSLEEAAPLSATAPYPLKGKLAAAGVESDGSSLRVPLSALIGPWVRWSVPLDRTRDLMVPGPTVTEVTATLQLPEGFRLQNPLDASLRKSVGEFAVKAEQQGDVVTLTRRVGVFARYVPRDRHAELRELVLEAAKLDATILTFSPRK